MKAKDDNATEKVDNLRDDLDIKEQFKDLRNDFRIIEENIESILDSDFSIDLLKKPLITFKHFNLGMKILENAFCIIMKAGIYIYSKDLQEVRVF